MRISTSRSETCGAQEAELIWDIEITQVLMKIQVTASWYKMKTLKLQCQFTGKRTKQSNLLTSDRKI